MAVLFIGFSGSAQESLTEQISNDQNHQLLFKIVQSSSMAQTLSQEEEAYTVFAPSNESLSQAFRENTSYGQITKSSMENIVAHNIVKGKWTLDKLKNKLNSDGSFSLTNEADEKIEVSMENGKVYLKAGDKTAELQSPTQASNGLLYNIDVVFIN